jgi:hypothetical protein
MTLLSVPKTLMTDSPSPEVGCAIAVSSIATAFSAKRFREKQTG